MSSIPELLALTNINDLGINDFIALLLTVADKTDAHPALKDGLPEYFSNGQKLREIAGNLTQLRDAASTGNRDAKAEKIAAWEAGKLAVAMNAQHLTMLSLHRKDPSLLNNIGLELKQKQQGGRSAVNVLAETPVVSAKHVQGPSGPVSGSIVLVISRAKSSIPFELQMTDDPSNESSWSSQGIHQKARIEYHGQEPAKRLYFRVRYHVDGKTSQWSPTANIIVL